MLHDTLTHFLLVHGWGMDAAFWQPLVDLFPPSWTHEHVDPYAPLNPIGVRAEPRRVLLTHSAGLVYAMHHLPATTWDVWIACNGFAAFSGDSDLTPCVPAPEIRALRRAVLHKPEQTVNRFRAGLGVLHPSALFPVASLLDWLDALAIWHVNDAPLLRERRGLVLGGAHDPLVPTVQSAALVAHTGAAVAFCLEGVHNLPMTHPAWCQTEIARFLGILTNAT